MPKSGVEVAWLVVGLAVANKGCCVLGLKEGLGFVVGGKGPRRLPTQLLMGRAWVGVSGLRRMGWLVGCG